MYQKPCKGRSGSYSGKESALAAVKHGNAASIFAASIIPIEQN